MQWAAPLLLVTFRAACLVRLGEALGLSAARARWPLVPSPELWRQAADEEGIDPSSVSTFGSNVPKFPRSLVDKILSLNVTKFRSYNFQGTMHSLPGWPTKKFKRRNWVLDFARNAFQTNDFLNAPDVEASHEGIGTFDYSSQHKQTDELLNRSLGFFEVMAQSKFTLCPGGDEAWSKRAYEAVLAGSLPVIRSTKDDWSPRNKWDSIGSALQAVFDEYRYVKVDELATARYQPRWTEENRRKFIKYQTFIEGDNVPEGYKQQWAKGQTKNAYPCGHIVFAHTTQKELDICGQCCKK